MGISECSRSAKRKAHEWSRSEELEITGPEII
jgi:hypothetical protein